MAFAARIIAIQIFIHSFLCQKEIISAKSHRVGQEQQSHMDLQAVITTMAVNLLTENAKKLLYIQEIKS